MAGAELDCTKAVSLDGESYEARYRRAMARHEMNQKIDASIIRQFLRACPRQKWAGEAAKLERKAEATYDAQRQSGAVREGRTTLAVALRWTPGHSIGATDRCNGLQSTTSRRTP